MSFFDNVVALSLNFMVAKRPINGISSEMAIKHFGIFGQSNRGCEMRQGFSGMFF